MRRGNRNRNGRRDAASGAMGVGRGININCASIGDRSNGRAAGKRELPNALPQGNRNRGVRGLSRGRSVDVDRAVVVD